MSKDYRDTLNLPQTDLSMKAGLAKKEPELLSYWDSIDLYTKIREQNKGKKQFILHDGPPYANGDIHLGPVSYYTSPSPRDRTRSRMPSSA